MYARSSHLSQIRWQHTRIALESKTGENTTSGLDLCMRNKLWKTLHDWEPTPKPITRSRRALFCPLATGSAHMNRATETCVRFCARSSDRSAQYHGDACCAWSGARRVSASQQHTWTRNRYRRQHIATPTRARSEGRQKHECAERWRRNLCKRLSGTQHT